MEASFSEGRILMFGIPSKAIATEQREVHIPQWVQASSSIS
jgi:hypothetical protein